MASATEWNRLPQSVRSQHTITDFQSELKTSLFRLAYPPPWYISLVGANLDLDEDVVSILCYLNVSILFYATCFINSLIAII